MHTPSKFSTAFRKGMCQYLVAFWPSNPLRRYVYYLSAMKKTEESLRRLKKGKKATFSLFGTSNPGKDDEGRDEERIRTQMIHDVDAFGKDAQSLGVELDSSESYQALKDMVYAIEGVLSVRWNTIHTYGCWLAPEA